VRLESKLSNGMPCLADTEAPLNLEEKGCLMNRDVVWKNFVDTWLVAYLL
jgi:cyclohexadienyl dehydratase